MDTESTSRIALTETIIKIENDLDVNKIKYNDRRIWPLVRLAIYMRLELIDNKSMILTIDELFSCQNRSCNK